MPPEKFRVALVQMSCGPEPEQNLEKALSRVADAAGRGAQRRLLAGTFPDPVFLPARRSCAIRSSGVYSRAHAAKNSRPRHAKTELS